MPALTNLYTPIDDCWIKVSVSNGGFVYGKYFKILRFMGCYLEAELFDEEMSSSGVVFCIDNKLFGAFKPVISALHHR